MTPPAAGLVPAPSCTTMPAAEQSRKGGWSGPWLTALDAAWVRTTLPPVAGAQDPALASSTVRLVVRWRSPGRSHPHKRTFARADAPAAFALARAIVVADLMGLAPGAGGIPREVTAAGPEPTRGDTTAGAGAANPTFAQRDVLSLRAVVPGSDAPSMHTPTPIPAPTLSPTTSAGDAVRPAGPAITGPATSDVGASDIDAAASGVPAPALPALPALPVWLVARPYQRADGLEGAGRWPEPGSNLGPTVEDYRNSLVEQHSFDSLKPGEDWLPRQLELLSRFFVYQPGDPRAVRYGLKTGGSLHLALLEKQDCAEALLMRRSVNLAAIARNQAKQAKYERSLQAYHLALERPGRRPVLPVASVLEQAVRARAEVSADPCISGRTEQAFGLAAAFLFDRAHDDHLFAGPNPWRLFNPRSNGGRARRARPLRRAAVPETGRLQLPGMGLLADLGDLMAERGMRLLPAVADSDLLSGERYRCLPLIVGTLTLRPMEVRSAFLLPRDLDHPDRTRFQVRPLPNGHLKHCDPGQTRDLDLPKLTRFLLDEHVLNGAGVALHVPGQSPGDVYVFASPTGRMLDTGNLTEDFLRPALTILLGPGGLWKEFGPILDNELDRLNLLRKIGLSTWLAYGRDTALTAASAGHGEDVLLRYYKGAMEVGKKREWTDVNAGVHAALTDSPPRGSGDLACFVRQWTARTQP